MAKNAAPLPALKLSFPAGQGLNEDQILCMKRPDLRLLAAFDGCGGVGGRRYTHMNNRTGAHIASGLYARCLKQWFKENAKSLPLETVADDLDTLFSSASKAYNAKHLEQTTSSVTGSMVRTLPSTAAIALLHRHSATLYWAGNTRGYLLSMDGLKQLTRDDTATQGSAFDSLYLDAPIANYLCADQPFHLHETTVDLPKKGVLVLATDGAYHALPTPMHFEALLLDTLEGTAAKKQWKARLQTELLKRAADDVTLILQPFGFAAYGDLGAYFDKRRRHVRQAYILPADQAAPDDILRLRSLWEMYEKE